MNSSPFKYEGWLYWLAFLIALGLRLAHLGTLPLTDSEARLALQALQLARGEAPLLDPQPGYILLTSVLFGIIEATNFMARVLPALVGSALVFVPYFFQDKIKPRPALILAFLFAIDPGLVAVSRQANGTMLAVTFLLFAWAMWQHQRPILAGVLAGLALLSGPSLWAGLLTLGLTWFFLWGLGFNSRSSETADQSPITNYQLRSLEFRPALLSLLITLLFGGTLFFLSPNGLSAWLSALPEYLRGWVSASSMTPSRVLLAFFAYEALGIFLAILSLVRGYRTKSRRILRLALWLAVALLLAIFYRQPAELLWAIIPLLALGSLELARAFQVFAEERVELGVVVLALLILLAYIWFGVSKIALDPIGQLSASTVPLFGGNVQVAGAPYIVLLAASLIIVLCVSFVAFGWSARTARLGTTWAFVIFLGVYTLAAAWGASGVRTRKGIELWTTDQPPVQADWLRSTLDDVSEFSLGHDTSQPVTVMGIDSPALEWVLRDRSVEMVSALDPQAAPPIVITPFMDVEDLGLPAAYRGQDFTWRQTPAWEQLQNPDWIRWLVFRKFPREEQTILKETIILWVRDDLFPDAREVSQ